MNIREAIETLAFKRFGDWKFYVDNLFTDEFIEEMENVKEAETLCKLCGITDDDIRKHWERQNNVVYNPVRFVDRVHFKSVETDDLPF